MVTLNAHYDGQFIVPDEPVSLKTNQKLRISIETVETTVAEAVDKPKRRLGRQRGIEAVFAPDWEDPLPDDIWDHNKDEQAKP